LILCFFFFNKKNVKEIKKMSIVMSIIVSLDGKNIIFQYLIRNPGMNWIEDLIIPLKKEKSCSIFFVETYNDKYIFKYCIQNII
jgi:hypothetical protein